MLIRRWCVRGTAAQNATHFSMAPSRDGSRIEIAGELDVATAPAMVAAAVGRPPARVLTIDLTGVTFIDAAGLNGLVQIHNRLTMAGAHLSISGAAPHLVRVFILGRAAWLLRRPAPDPRILDQLTAVIVNAALESSAGSHGAAQTAARVLS